MGKETWARELGREKKPGPADYDTREEPGVRTPRYSIKQKYQDRAPPYAPPYRDIGTTLAPTPAYTLRPKTAERPPDETPGPDFIPPRFADNYLRRSNGTLSARSGPKDVRHSRYPSYNHDPNGPGAFDCRKYPHFVREPAYTIGENCGEGWLHIDDNPGASDYSPRHMKVKKSAPKYTIGSINPKKEEIWVPGPGKYDVPYDFGRRALSVRAKPKELRGFNTPGPGSYNIQEPLGQKSRKCQIRACYSERANEPGVGYYTVPREFDSPPGKTIGVRSPRNNRDNFPGPGDYSPKKPWNSGKGHGMCDKNGMAHSYSTWLPNWKSPGPAEYTADDTPTTPRAPRFSLRDTDGPSWLNKAQSPGPAAHHQDNTVTKKRAPRYTCRPKCPQSEPKSATQDAGYLVLPKHQIPPIHIRPREDLNLIPQ